MSTDDESVALHQRLHELEALANALETDRARLKEESESQVTRVKQLVLDRDHSTTTYQEAKDHLEQNERQFKELEKQQHDLDNVLQIQVEERRRAQTKVVQLEMELTDLAEKHESLEHKFDLLRARQSSVKCRLCGVRGVEFALLPCFHFCYCQQCAEGLETCLVCREAKQGIQKIYYG
ncbi:hypothetical protein BJV82DRAFT_669753 [Fennellomyces sp. T-0311]|nr:hypothetical protein BJV82DRAFT_669753 [Fennellomyces sp. T-0311]